MQVSVKHTFYDSMYVMSNRINKLSDQNLNNFVFLRISFKINKNKMFFGYSVFSLVNFLINTLILGCDRNNIPEPSDLPRKRFKIGFTYGNRKIIS